jgi:multidrug efflux pump subunit AcrB
MDKLTVILFFGAVFSSSLLVSAQVPSQASTELSNDARDHLNDIDRFIAQRKSSFAISGKKMDVFGLPQDPKKAQAEKEKVAKVAKAKPKPSVPLQKIVDALPVTLIDPVHDRVVLSGAPPLQVGETLELAYKGQTIMLRFEGSRSSGAYFRDMKSQELRLRQMTRLPKGISKGNTNQTGNDAIRKIDLNKTQSFKIDLNGMVDSR